MIAPRQAKGELSLRDRLSRLNYLQACSLFESDGAALIRSGGKYEIRVDAQVTLGEDRLVLRLAEAEVTIRLCDRSRHRLRLDCSACTQDCEHVGAALSVVLEEKLTLGLSAPPREDLPPELLTEEELIERAIAERQQRARKERMRVKSVEPRKLWTDYLVTNADSGKTYRVALRGWERGDSYCTCPDFRKNTLGLCKHILNVQRKARRRFSASTCGRAFKQKDLAVHLRYGEELELWLLAPEEIPAGVKESHRASDVAPDHRRPQSPSPHSQARVSGTRGDDLPGRRGAHRAPALPRADPIDRRGDSP